MAAAGAISVSFSQFHWRVPTPNVFCGGRHVFYVDKGGCFESLLGSRRDLGHGCVEFAVVKCSGVLLRGIRIAGRVLGKVSGLREEVEADGGGVLWFPERG